MTTDLVPVPAPAGPAIDPTAHLAHQAITVAHAEPIATVRTTIGDRQRHVAAGVELAALARAARSDALAIEQASRADRVRPDWLTSQVHTGAKLALIVAEVTAGSAALYNSGDPLLFAVATFVGVAIATVVAGTNVGIQLRRRELGQRMSLVVTGAMAIALATVMVIATRFLTVGAFSAVMGLATTMIAIGSAVLGYLWHDPAADDVTRAWRLERRLARQARRELDHKTVRRFERAEAELRPALVGALLAAQEKLHRPPLALSGQRPGGTTAPPTTPPTVLPPDKAMVERLLVMLVGEEILHLIPKTGVEVARS